MDLAPGYRELAPPAGLRHAVACLWLRVVPVAGPPTRVLPDGCVDLVWRAGDEPWIAGPDTGPTMTSSPPGTVIAGVRFLPGAGGPALSIPLSEVRDAQLPLGELWPEAAERLTAVETPREAIVRLTGLAARLARSGSPDPAVRAAARRLSDPQARLEALADDLGLSDRQLRRRCHTAVGYGPKTLQRVLRFRGFLARADAAGADADLARLALDAGYADQAHLTRECTRLAGLPPAALARARAAG